MTRFEQEILALVWLHHETYFQAPFIDIYLHRQGCSRFGKGWGGAKTISRTGYNTCPQLNMALGRLARKGLVERGSHPHFSTRTRKGTWTATVQGVRLGQHFGKEWGLI